MSHVHKTGHFLGTLPETDFWLTWQSSHDDCGKTWTELRDKFLRDSSRNLNMMASLNRKVKYDQVEVAAAVASPRQWLPKYEDINSMKSIGDILISFGYPY